MKKKQIANIQASTCGWNEEIQQPSGTSLVNEPITGGYRDSFRRIFGAIEEYHTKLGYPKVECASRDRIAQHRQFCLAINAEVTELLDAVPWKPWRPDNYKNVDYVNLAEEIIDIIFFLSSVREIWRLTPEMLADLFERKLIENNRRIQDGYNKPSDEM